MTGPETSREIVMNVLGELRPVEIRVGDYVQVDTRAYALPGPHWCEVTRFAIGEAAQYPVKVAVPDRGEGQFNPYEILDHRDAAEGPPPQTTRWLVTSLGSSGVASWACDMCGAATGQFHTSLDSTAGSIREDATRHVAVTGHQVQYSHGTTELITGLATS